MLLQEEYVLLGQTPAANHVPHHSHSHRLFMDPHLYPLPLPSLPRLLCLLRVFLIFNCATAIRLVLLVFMLLRLVCLLALVRLLVLLLVMLIVLLLALTSCDCLLLPDLPHIFPTSTS